MASCCVRHPSPGRVSVVRRFPCRSSVSCGSDGLTEDTSACRARQSIKERHDLLELRVGQEDVVAGQR
eukprot:11130292-Heterocapsa_arctica.AAC.1